MQCSITHCIMLSLCLPLLVYLAAGVVATAGPALGEEGGVSQNDGTPLPPPPAPYVINQADKCPEGRPPPFLVFLIPTRAHEMEARAAIRQTWANQSLFPDLGVVRLFLLGLEEGGGKPQQQQWQRAIEAESRRHGDILQAGFPDTYRNVVLKTLTGLHWVARHCPRARYVMKVDSDVFVNTPYLVRHVLRPEMQPPRRDYLTGRCPQTGWPIRNQDSKWYLSREEYPSEHFPPFCFGPGYVMSGDLAVKIYRASPGVRPRLHLEDVYVGMCAAHLGVKTADPGPGGSAWSPFHNLHVPFSVQRYSNLAVAHDVRPAALLEYWDRLAAVSPDFRSASSTGKL